MAEFKKWISYLYAYNGEVKGKNVGFARVELRDGRCRLAVGMKGAYGCDPKGLDVGLYIRQDGRPQRISVGHMRIWEGCGEFTEMTDADDLFGKGVALSDCGGLWLCCEGRDTFYLASWEKSCLDVRDFLPQENKEAAKEAAKKTDVMTVQIVDKTSEEPQEDGSKVPMAVRRPCRRVLVAAQQTNRRKQDPPELQLIDVARRAPSAGVGATLRSAGAASVGMLENLPRPSLWESLCRYYPKTAPELQAHGVELLQIRPADIRYLPRRLWHYGSNSFLLHGYYHYKYLILGRVWDEQNPFYILGVRGLQTERERCLAEMFGFQRFLSLDESGQEGYWYTQITL